MNLYQRCEDLLARYPLAGDPDAGGVSMAVMTTTPRGDPEFFGFHRTADGPTGSFWSVGPWGAAGVLVARPGGSTAMGFTGADAGRMLGRAVPLPRDGSLFGWVSSGTVTGLVAIYVRADEHYRVPSWASLPLAAASKDSWPPSGCLFGSWFWDGLASGRIVDLGPAVAATRGAVYWVDVPGVEWGSCAVARDVSLPGGCTLPRGLFAYYGSLRAAARLPDVADVLAMPGKTDLAPRFHRFAEAA